MAFDENAKLGELLADEKAAAILEKYMSGISTHPAMGLLHAYTIKQIAEYPQSNLPEPKVAVILAELAAL